MRYKYKLSFSVLMISSCLIPFANAVENKNRELTRATNVGSGGTVPNGSALITNMLPSTNIKIEEGGVEIVENGLVSLESIIQKGGMQIVTRGGTALKAKVLGGQQFVHEEKGIDLANVVRRSSAYSTTVSGEGGAIGQQNVYDGAWAWYTKVENDGEQNLYAGNRKDGGKSKDTMISGNGRQHVLAGGESFNTTLKGQAAQVVYPGGAVNTLTITEFAKSWLYVNAKEVVGKVRVNDKGKLYLFAGDITNHIIKKEIPIKDRPKEIIFGVGERNVGEKPQIAIEDLGGQNGTVIFSSIPYDPRHISLHVERLSGSLHFRFNISATWDASDYLSIGDGTGNHKIRVADSGAEIAGSLSQRNSFVTELPLITDRSQVEGANFTLADLSGKGITAVDGGAYQYALQKRARCADSSGSTTIWYLSRISESIERSNSEVQCVNKKIKVPVTASDQSAPSGRKNTGPKKPTRKEQPKPRPPRHLRETQNVSNVSVSSSQENRARVVLPSESPHSLSVDKQQMAVSASSQSLADHMTLRPSNQEQPSSHLSEKLSVSDFLTTPSTDAVLSMSVAPAMVFHNEMQSVRMGRGILDNS
uniref:pertactin-like passenger domain-containing protein n=1 Tax=Bartonella gabonensis TaxID=2699889 RepID=UPI00158B23B6